VSYADTIPGPDGWGPARFHGDHPQGWVREFGGDVRVGGLFRHDVGIVDAQGLTAGRGAGSRVYRKISAGKAKDINSHAGGWLTGPTPVWVPVNEVALETELRRRRLGAEQGLDFTSVFVPLARKTTIRASFDARSVGPERY